MVVYSQPLRNNSSDPAGSTIISEVAMNASSVFYGQSISMVKFYLYNPASNTGTLTCGIYESDGTLKHTFYTMDMSTLPTVDEGLITPDSCTAFTGALAVGDGIGVKTDSQAIKLPVQLTDVFDGVNTAWRSNATTNTSYDCAFEITTGAGVTATTTMPPPPAWVRI